MKKTHERKGRPSESSGYLIGIPIAKSYHITRLGGATPERKRITWERRCSNGWIMKKKEKG